MPVRHDAPFFARNFIPFFSFLLVFSACQKQKETTSEPADMVIRNARVYTVDPQPSWAQAVAVKDDRIVWVGNDDGVSPHIGRATQVIDASGKMMLPGFIDSHFHVL